MATKTKLDSYVERQHATRQEEFGFRSAMGGPWVPGRTFDSVDRETWTQTMSWILDESQC